MSALPEIDRFWDFSDPAGSEARFAQLLEDFSDAPADYRAEVLSQLARAQGLQGRFEDARNSLDRATALSEDERVRIRVLLEQGRLCNSAKTPRPELFEQAYERAMEAGLDHYAIDAAHMRAIVAGPEQQLHWNQVAMELAERTEDPRGQRWLGSLYNNIGYALMEQGDHPGSIAVFEKLQVRCDVEGDIEFARIARWFIGKNLRLRGAIESARDVQHRLMEEYEAAGAPSPYVFEELGECEQAWDDGDPEACQAHFTRAIALFEADPQYALEMKGDPERFERMRRLASG